MLHSCLSCIKHHFTFLVLLLIIACACCYDHEVVPSTSQLLNNASTWCYTQHSNMQRACCESTLMAGPPLTMSPPRHSSSYASTWEATVHIQLSAQFCGMHTADKQTCSVSALVTAITTGISRALHTRGIPQDASGQIDCNSFMRS